MIEVEYRTQAPDWIRGAVCQAAQAALSHEGRAGDITFALVDDDAIHALNRDYRHVDRPTDVLSFPAWEGEALLSQGDYLGDVAISLPTALRQAEEYGHGALRELRFLALHGTLHLLGYDHMRSEDEKVMFALQNEILAKIEAEDAKNNAKG